MSLEYEQVVSAVQLILFLCIFRMGGDSLHSVCESGFTAFCPRAGTAITGLMMTRAYMDWRRPLRGKLRGHSVLYILDTVWKQTKVKSAAHVRPIHVIRQDFRDKPDH